MPTQKWNLSFDAIIFRNLTLLITLSL